MEEWKTFPPSRGQYEISNLGRVRNARTGRILKGFTYKTGAKGVNLGGHVKKTYTIAKLVAYCFLTTQSGRVTHIENLSDDRPENLIVWTEDYYD